MITLNTPITVSLGVTANAYKASKFTDNTIDKNVSAFIDYYFIEKESSKLVHQAELIIWSGAEYDLAGDYTQADIDAKINSLINK
ncbi:hypothetical protein [uncultured Flavobacterium sp.]|uniref:hypothetical protein n=1 Tax=uncultured Flavobacterium sp. TaxID=165435 RepID=UPI002594CBBA|nr:hypothetical protein [uncultured Flavobacterium sp.]